MKKLTSLFLSLNIIAAMMLSPGAHAQSEDIIKSTQNDILLIVGAGAGGAILGLSTLSFVDKPSKHISNVWTGAAIGVIAGVIFVAYNSAQRGSEDLQSSSEFNSSERLAWHSSHSQKATVEKVQFGSQIWQLSF